MFEDGGTLRGEGGVWRMRKYSYFVLCFVAIADESYGDPRLRIYGSWSGGVSSGGAGTLPRVLAIRRLPTQYARKLRDPLHSAMWFDLAIDYC